MYGRYGRPHNPDELPTGALLMLLATAIVGLALDFGWVATVVNWIATGAPSLFAPLLPHVR